MKFELVEKHSQVTSLVAELDGKLIGFIIGDASSWEYGVPKSIGWINIIGADPEYPMEGIAKILFTELTNKLKKVGIDTIYTFGSSRRDWKLLKSSNSMDFQKGDMINLELNI